MNPYDTYKRQMVITAPLTKQLARLHQQAAIWTNQIVHFVEVGNFDEARKHIVYIEDILTFLRTTLNHRIDVSKKADSTYIFYYQMAVNWYINPQLCIEQHEHMYEFWETWAKTWEKVII